MEAISQPIDLEQLFRDTKDDLCRYFERRHSDRELTRDLVQDTFVELAKETKKGRSPKSWRAYLFGIARNLSMSAWRRQKRDSSLAYEDYHQAGEQEETGLDDRVTQVKETIATMPQLQREILDLRFTQDLSYAEIAEVLSIPVGTVRSRLHNAVLAARKSLAEKDTEPSNPTES